MTTLKKLYYIDTPIHKVWQALTDELTIDNWGGGPAEMSDQVGTQFKLWDGDIFGKNVQVEEDELLVQEWFSGSWQTPSIVSLNLTEDEDGLVEIELTHENIPDDEADAIEQMWDSEYFGAIKTYLEEEI